MWQLVVKLFNCLAMHKFSFEIAAIGVGGIAIPDLANVDHLVKIMVGIVTVFVIVNKELRERRKHESNKNL